jgi:hypothetical protein
MIGSPKEILFEFPEEYQPDFDSVTDSTTDAIDSSSSVGRMVGEITIKDLIDNKMISVGDKLMMQYGPRGQKKKNITVPFKMMAPYLF